MIAIFTNDELFKFAVANMREHAVNTLAEKMHMDVLRSEDGLPEHKKEGFAERMYEHNDMLRKQLREEPMCSCSSYSFPHRIGSGKCIGPEYGTSSLSKTDREELEYFDRTEAAAINGSR